MTYDAVVIGAGLSGLAAGLRLALADRRVLLLESHSIPGGYNSFYRRGSRRLDVGLHAMTNFAPKGARGLPLSTLLKQLRLRYDDLALKEQWQSRIEFPSAQLTFTNDFARLRDEVHQRFPQEGDRFDELVEAIRGYDEADPAAQDVPSRPILGEHLREPLLIDMLLCPILFYGAPGDHDIGWPAFVMLFKGMYLQGLCRPRDGMQPLVERLAQAFVEHGGELRYRAEVSQIVVQDGRAARLRLTSGEEIEAAQIFSSAGRIETERLRSDRPADADADAVGSVSIVEFIACTDRLPREMGMDSTIVFASRRDSLAFRRPEDLVDYGSVVLCASNNYGAGDALDEGRVRVSHLASFSRWRELLGAERLRDADEAARARYQDAKREVETRCLAEAGEWMPGFAERVVFGDTFTPLTLKRFTGHLDGALYGSTRKARDGRTDLENLFLIGTDQGFHGIVGSLLSGCTIANWWGRG